jgi:serine/threonine protein kinase
MQAPPGLPSRFETLRRIGVGGMGIVYEARDSDRNLRVAIKTLQKADSRLLYLLKQEFRSLADIAHPNLVALHELVSDGEAWFLVMEYIEGVDLIRHVRNDEVVEPVHRLQPDAATQTILAPTQEVTSSDLIALPAGASEEPRRPPLSDQAQFDRLRAIVTQLVQGVAALHRAGKLHRDIKPGNVMIARDGRAVLLDFGLAADVKGTLHDGALESTTAGTFVYMSPEQAMGLKLSEASDWYSLGVMIYETIAGRLPFWANSRLELQRARVAQDPPPVSYWAPATPADLAAVCAGLLHPKPEQRLTGKELIALLKGDTGAPAANQPHAFVGRERQLQDLQNAFAETTHSRTVAAYVRGSSGMGKSQLISHFLRDLERLKGTMVLRGRCYERESVPFKAVDSLVDALARRLGRFPVEELGGFLLANAGALARIFPVLEPIVQSCSHSVPAGMDRQELRLAAFASLREILRRLAKQFRLVLYIDDLQWGRCR